MVITIPTAVYLYKKNQKKKDTGLLINAEADKRSASQEESKETVPEGSKENDKLPLISASEEQSHNENSQNAAHLVSASKSPNDNIQDNSLHPLLSAKYLLIGGGTASHAAMQAILQVEPDANVHY